MAIQSRGTKALRVPTNIRIPNDRLEVIDHAANLVGKSRSQFVVDSAYREAEEVLRDQTAFILSAKDFDRFKELLDNPPPPTQALIDLMNTPAPWDKE